MKTNNRRWRRFYLLLQKRHLKSPKVYCLTALCLLFLYVFQNVVFPTSYRMDYGVYVEDAKCADAVLEILLSDDLYNCVVMDSRQALYDEVRAGRLDCGFVFDRRMDTITWMRGFDKLIDYVISTSTTKGNVLREKVFAAYLQSAMSMALTEVAADGRSYLDADENTVQEINDYFRHYMNGNETLQLIFETVDTSETAVSTQQQKDAAAAVEFSLSDVSLLDKFLALCATMIFIAAVIFGRVRFSSECRRMRDAMRGTDREVWPFLSILAQVLPVTVVMLIAYITGLGIYGVLTPGKVLWAVPVFLVYGFACAVWAGVYSRLFTREAMYLGSLVGVIVLSMVTCKPFFRMNMFFPAIDILKWLFPMNYLV